MFLSKLFRKKQTNCGPRNFKQAVRLSEKPVIYFSRSLDDTSHLYKYVRTTKEFYWMDHCWTGEGEWVLREEPYPNIVEITEERAMKISLGTLYTAQHFDK